MYKDKIKEYFEKWVMISDEEFEHFSSQLVRKDLPKNSIILSKGEVENHLSFIEQGIVRFNLPELDHDLTFDFAFPGHFVSAYESFLTRSPSNYHVWTISKCTLWQISYNDLEGIYNETDVGNIIGRKVAEDLYIKKTSRTISLLRDPAKKRYLDLFNMQPELIRNIPLKYLASYLGIRPQSLSRVRKDIY